MDLQDCLRAEVGELRAIVDALVPEVAARRGWVSRVISFLSCVVA
jgi:hypothetical protein